MRYVILLLCFPLLTLSNPLEIIEDSPSKLVLRWTMPEWDSVTVAGSDVNGTRLMFSFSNVDLSDRFNAYLPGYSFSFGIPLREGVNVTFNPDSISAINLLTPLQSVSNQRKSDGPHFAARWVSEVVYTSFREYSAATLYIRPFSYDGNRIVQVLEKATITIQFPPAYNQGVIREPDSDYERMIKRILVNFQTAQGWIGKPFGLKKQSAAKRSFPFENSQKLYTFRIGDGNDGFNECSNNENGIVRIKGKQVTDLFGESVGVGSVALYASPKFELGSKTPAPDDIPSGVMEIPLLRYDLNGNGKVDQNDCFLAYVSGTSDWVYDKSKQFFTYELNRYDDYRKYWLTVKKDSDALTMGKFVQPEESVKIREYFQNNAYFRTPDTLSWTNSSGGIDWVWFSLSDNKRDIDLNLNLGMAEKNRPGSLRLVRGSVNSSLSARLGNRSLCQDCSDEWLPVTDWNSSSLELQYTYGGSGTTGHFELAGIHVRYDQKIRIDSTMKKMMVFSDTAAAVSYKCGKIGEELAYVFRIPETEAEVSLVDTSRDAIIWSDQGGLGTRYLVISESGFTEIDDFREVTYQSEGKYQIRELRSPQNRTDYLIVTHEKFQEAAQKLAIHKENIGFLQPRIVLMKDIYNQFSGGNTDPSALRNFLFHVYSFWNKGKDLSYVILVGTGHYNYKKVRTTAENFIPTAQMGKLFTGKSNYCTDDYFVLFDSVSFEKQHNACYYLGRLPAKTASEAHAMVEKIIEVEDPAVADYGPWRNRFVLVADDDMQKNKKDNITYHHTQSEDLWNRVGMVRPALDMRKIYLFDFPWNEQLNKPGATRALINEINQGVAAVNWFGHGSPIQWSDELTLDDRNIGSLNNPKKQYPLITSFSCSVGKFDSPDEECLSELLTKQPYSGAIATIASTRESNAPPNGHLANNFYELLFAPGSDVSIGSAFMQAKASYPNANNRLYVLLGDPSIRLTPTNRQMDLEITESGNTLDTLKALQKVTIKGKITNGDGSVDSQIGGSQSSVLISLFGPPEKTARKDGGTETDPAYFTAGNLIFSSDAHVSNGVFEQTFVLPMNVPFNKSGIKLTAYAYSDSFVSTGFKKDLVFGGSMPLESFADTTGPQISFRPVYNTQTIDNAGLFVTNRLSVQLPLQCEIRIFDESGINVNGSGPGEGITMEIKGTLSRRNLSNYQYVNGDFRHLIAVFTLDEGEIIPGQHEMLLTAQDLIGNISKHSVKFEILEKEDLRLDHVLNIPNPMRMGKGTRFYFYPSSSVEYFSYYSDSEPQIHIKIYSLGGRLLKVIRNPHNGVFWDGRDGRGNLLSPNVYLYQVTASYPQQNRKVIRSDVKKLVVHPPR